MSPPLSLTPIDLKLCSGCGCPLPQGGRLKYCGVSAKSLEYDRCKKRAARGFKGRGDSLMSPTSPPIGILTEQTYVDGESITHDLLRELITELRQLRQENADLKTLLADRPAQQPPVMTGNLKVPVIEFSPPPDDDFDVMDSIEIRKDESAAARSSENMRRTLMAMYNKEGQWGVKPQQVEKAGSRL